MGARLPMIEVRQYRAETGLGRSQIQTEQGQAMDDDSTEAAATDPARSRLPNATAGGAVGRRWPWTVVRAVVVLQALDAFLQPVFAGRFLSGDFGMLAAHKHNALYGLFTLSVLQVVAAALAWRLANGPGWLVITATVLTGAVLLQIILGFDRVLGIHVPLGVAIIVALVWSAVWVCGHEPTDRPFRRPRPRGLDRYEGDR